MKILKSKKILLSLICALVLVFGSCMTVCASEYSQEYTDAYDAIYNYAVTNGTPVYEYQLFYHLNGTGSCLYLITTDSEPYYYKTENGRVMIPASVVDGQADVANCTTYTYNRDSGEISYSENVCSLASDYTLIGSAVGTSTYNYYYSSFKMKVYGETYSRESQSDFFPKPSPLVTVARTIQPTTVLAQILGLMPLLIPCLVGLVALRKGLQALWGHLHKA